MEDNQDGAAPSAFVFHGSWKEFAPIAFTNLLLTIVTLGIYRFWATTRERQYFWNKTQFIDDRLEWTGTGLELFIGFLMVLFLFGLPFFALQFGVQALALRGYGGIAGLVGFSAFILIFYLGGVARFRALRYRLGRTYWHGIRGGSDEQGFAYGWSFIWKSFVGMLVAGLLIPWSMVDLWNQRWRSMSFGPHKFQSNGDFTKIMLRFVLAYILPFVAIFGLLFAAIAAVGLSAITAQPQSGELNPALGGFIIFFVLAFYLIFPLVYLYFYSAFFREVVGGLSLSALDFAFTARTKDWVKLILGDIGLVIITLGIGYIFLSYRHWKFFVTHMEAYGEVDLDTLLQSETQRSKHGEGLLDAFDVGAI